MDEVEDQGLIRNMGRGAYAGLLAGLFVGSGRAYLAGQDVTTAQTMVATSTRGATRVAAAQALKAALTNKPARILGITTALYTSVGAIFTGLLPMVQNARGKKDPLNPAMAGCAAGTVVGLRSGSLYVSGGACASFAFVAAFLDVLGGTMGPTHDRTTERRREMYNATSSSSN